MPIIAVVLLVFVLEIAVRGITRALPYTAEISLVDQLLQAVGLDEISFRYSIPSKLIFVSAGVVLFLSLMKTIRS